MLNLLIRFCVKEPWLVVMSDDRSQRRRLVRLQGGAHRRDPQRWRKPSHRADALAGPFAERYRRPGHLPAERFVAGRSRC